MWEPDGAEGHVGKVGVLLEDGTVPGPVYIDIGSGSYVPSFTDWWYYDGVHRRPLADRMRAVCACGWQCETTYPIDWKRVPHREPYLYDTSAPERDWENHTRQINAAAVPLPQDVARLISQIRERLDDIEDTDPLTALRIVGALDAVVETDGPYATRLATRKHTDEEIATALGSTEKALAARLRRYDNTRF
ncbi:hypothetical protein HHL19_22425 [Streptomyces sp. R302]|uniref:hypothetical protein n=1 Tax=unclassified Streptomyces TaxID=2593676 RepID=UPI00145CE959|nr:MULTISPECIES: hypothetical protein [unclassified Streptomyces]NML51718.1 hypothetical protein [Streptomyces sp. R301]NML81338.1 hypothetical protein [Streptomyces sp. R302]